MKIVYLLLVPCLCLASCAMFTRGGREKFTVTSEPTGANVELSSGEKGVTPVTFQKSRKEQFTVSVSKTGYAEQTVAVSSLKPNPVSVHLLRAKSSRKPAAPKTKPEGTTTTPKKAPAEATPAPTAAATATPMPASSPVPEQPTPEATTTPEASLVPESSPTP